MRLHRLANRVFNTPLAIHEAKLDVIVAVMLPHMGVSAEPAPTLTGEPEKREIYSVDSSGIATISISGSLVNRTGGMDAYSGMTSYEEIAGELARAVADPAVKGIMLRVESPGGEAIGLSGISQAVTDANQAKPVWCSIDAYAFSAAYWIASACEQIFVPVDGECGSIGCIAKHFDFSAAIEEEGIKVTTVAFGAHKADYSQDAPLSTEAYARLKADVDELGGMFVASVARNRNLARSAVRSTEALTYMGQKCLAVGLADQLGGYPAAMAALSAQIATGKRMLERRSAPAVIVPASISDADKRGAHLGIERRQFNVEDLRSVSGEEPHVNGHMAVFDQWSGDCGGFIEILKPGAFTKTLKEQDIHSYYNHDSNYVLGRVKSGTLRLTEDNTGLYSENDPPDTQTIRDLVLEPIRRGDIDQGSIAFRHVRQEWGRVDGMLTRTLHEVRLYHVSPVPRGAYENTSVGLRTAADGLDIRAIEVVMAKQEHGLPLSDQERALLQQTIKAFQRCLTVAPGLAAHPAGHTAEPHSDMEALRTRLRRAKVAMLQPA